MKIYWFVLMILILVSSCKKSENLTCWKSAVKMADTVIYVTDFSKLSLNENMSFELVQDSLNKI